MGILPETATEERIGFNELRENTIFSTDNAPSDEKKPSSRRTTRPPTRKSHLLDGQRVLRREKAIFSTTVRQGEKMNPSGVQFGISQGLLQIRGDEVLLSEQLLKTISHEAQQHVQLGRRPIQGNF